MASSGAVQGSGMFSVAGLLAVFGVVGLAKVLVMRWPIIQRRFRIYAFLIFLHKIQWFKVMQSHEVSGQVKGTNLCKFTNTDPIHLIQNCGPWCTHHITAGCLWYHLYAAWNWNGNQNRLEPSERFWTESGPGQGRGQSHGQPQCAD